MIRKRLVLFNSYSFAFFWPVSLTVSILLAEGREAYVLSVLKLHASYIHDRNLFTAFYNVIAWSFFFF